MRILYAEDEPDLNHIITRRLTEEGYSVDSCMNGEDALYYLENTEYDAAILDIMMPGKSGLDVLRVIRAKGNHVPILFLTARDSVTDKVRGLDAGADDYLVKPFSVSELLARVRVMVRRDTDQAGAVLKADDLVMDLVAHRVKRGDNEIFLSGKEFALLEYLMHNQDMALSRDKIENHIWNYDYEGGTNVVDVYISHLRRKIDDGFEKKLIRTVRGIGYTLSTR